MEWLGTVETGTHCDTAGSEDSGEVSRMDPFGNEGHGPIATPWSPDKLHAIETIQASFEHGKEEVLMLPNCGKPDSGEIVSGCCEANCLSNRRRSRFKAVGRIGVSYA
jgi:hypothetical protein